MSTAYRDLLLELYFWKDRSDETKKAGTAGYPDRPAGAAGGHHPVDAKPVVNGTELNLTIEYSPERNRRNRIFE